MPNHFVPGEASYLLIRTALQSVTPVLVHLCHSPADIDMMSLSFKDDFKVRRQNIKINRVTGVLKNTLGKLLKGCLILLLLQARANSILVFWEVFLPLKVAITIKYPCSNLAMHQCASCVNILLQLAFTQCFFFYPSIWKNVTKEITIVIFIYTILFPPDHLFFIRSSVEGWEIERAVSYNYLLQTMHLIMQGKQSSAHSTPRSSICLCWWSIRCVKPSCGTGSFQHNCSVQSVF